MIKNYLNAPRETLQVSEIIIKHLNFVFLHESDTNSGLVRFNMSVTFAPMFFFAPFHFPSIPNNIHFDSNMEKTKILMTFFVANLTTGIDYYHDK